VSRISAAKPKIADYPFTTLEPHLGVVRVGGTSRQDADAVEFVVADIPGLIEGASEGRGLGHKFLRHVERARVLLVLADLGEDEGRLPTDQVRVLLDELGRYRPELLERPRMIIGSRADRRETPAGASGDRAAASRDSPELELDLEVSAVTGSGLPQLLGRLAALVEEARAEAPLPVQTAVVHRPEPEGVVVSRDGPVFVVTGKEAERAVAVSDLTNLDALEHVHRPSEADRCRPRPVAGRGARWATPCASGTCASPTSRSIEHVIVIAKIGTSSVTASDGSVDTEAVGKLCAEVAGLRGDGHTVVVVTSGAVTAGVAAVAPLGEYPTDPMTLQALSAIGQPRLMRVYEDALASHGLLAGQVLLAPLDFAHRQRYLHARATFTRLLELGVVPIVNENDAIADDEIRFGDNDRLAASRGPPAPS